MHDKSVYEIDYTDGKTEQLKDRILDENMISQLDYEGNQYQVVTRVTDNK